MQAHRTGSLAREAGGGLVWLSISVGVTLGLGLALQLIAVRTLTDGDYATFVFALGIGNIAAAIGGALQPVVAMRAGPDGGAFLPASLRILALGSGAVVGGLVVVLGPAVGWHFVLLATLQLPLHTLLAAGLGGLQAGSAFGRLAAGYGTFALARLLVVAPAVALGNDSPELFVGALPAALAISVLVAWGLGGYRLLRWSAVQEGWRAAGDYAKWAAFAWLVNGDAVYSRVFLDALEADRYGVALTLGRQAIYVVTPLLLVLLPLVRSSAAASQVERLRAIFVAFAVVLLASIIVLGIAPNAVAALVTGNDEADYAALVRAYSIAGPLLALASLQLTLLFALGASPGTRPMLALGCVVAAGAALVQGPEQMVGLQLGVSLVLAAWLSFAAWSATRTRTSAAPA